MQLTLECRQQQQQEEEEEATFSCSFLLHLLLLLLVLVVAVLQPPGGDEPPLPAVTAPLWCLITGGEAEESASLQMSRWMRSRGLSGEGGGLEEVTLTPVMIKRGF
ncbi:hypothetical protein PAMP_016652 [Pampus punctatissimus]